MKAILLIYSVIYTANNFFCACLPPSVEDNFKKSDLIFRGTVLKIDTIMITDEYIPKDAFRIRYLATLRVNKIFKGQNASDSIHIITGEGISDCGYFFKAGNNYLIYSKEQKYAVIDTLEIFNGKYISHEKSYFATTNCDRTTSAIKKEERLLNSYLSKSRSLLRRG